MKEMKAELPRDIAEEMADRFGLSDADGEHKEGCGCRECFTEDLTRRMREAVKEEMKLMFPTRRMKGLRSGRLSAGDDSVE